MTWLLAAVVVGLAVWASWLAHRVGVLSAELSDLRKPETIDLPSDPWKHYTMFGASNRSVREVELRKVVQRLASDAGLRMSHNKPTNKPEWELVKAKRK